MAFATFYLAETPAVVRHLMNQGATEHDAADAAQTAFMQAYKIWETVRYPRAWVRTVATREYLHFRARAREIPIDVRTLDGTVLGPALRGVEFSEEEQAVLGALAELPHRQREVMAWHFDGFTHAEIAEKLGTDPAAVRQSLARARRNLARRLGMQWKDTG
jgi:RNA polymerase sigma-70 factor (ECF subfamily)